MFIHTVKVKRPKVWLTVILGIIAAVMAVLFYYKSNTYILSAISVIYSIGKLIN